ncbi:MAG: NAD-dependent epimerase/dehydratase family protein [Bergeyella sp.]|nr:NAD-dependent epimerase/dehydratase family protein [Bergeyella sp.]
MNFLVTGGSGFIGSHLIGRLLVEGHYVINIDNFDDFYPYPIKINNTLESLGKEKKKLFNNKEKDLACLKDETRSPQYKLYTEDVRNAEELNKIFSSHKIDFVVHLASLAGVRPSMEKPLEYEEVNIRGSMNIWEMCKAHYIKKCIVASSSSVYGNNKKIPFSESDTVDFPISPYAATKRCIEIMGHVYHHLYEIDMIFLRFFTVYGPRQRPDLAIHKFSNLIAGEKEIPFFGNGNTSRDYTYIDDIIEGVMKSIDYLKKNQNVFENINLGENERISLNKMVSALESTLKKKAIKKHFPVHKGDVKKTNADLTKAKKMLGYQPKTKFQNGIKKFVAWFLAKDSVV